MAEPDDRVSRAMTSLSAANRGDPARAGPIWISSTRPRVCAAMASAAEAAGAKSVKTANTGASISSHRRVCIVRVLCVIVMPLFAFPRPFCISSVQATGQPSQHFSKALKTRYSWAPGGIEARLRSTRGDGSVLFEGHAKWHGYHCRIRSLTTSQSIVSESVTG